MQNIPIPKEQIDWLGDYASDEYEFVQFHVSKALGRVVGFFDEEQTFQIVLFDPFHNIQPAGDFDYRVRATAIGDCAPPDLIIISAQPWRASGWRRVRAGMAIEAGRRRFCRSIPCDRRPASTLGSRGPFSSAGIVKSANQGPTTPARAGLTGTRYLSVR
jgi:hypothetical protein